MNNQHVIEKAVVDISFGSEEEAFEQHASLGTLVRDRLMAVVDEVFDELSDEGQVVRIDNLEVNLGDMPYHGFAEEMAVRLRERLRSALQEKLLTFGEKPAAGEGVVSRDVSEMEQLTHFLTKGRMPWHAHPGKDGAIDQMLRRVLRSKGREFAEFVKKSSHREVVIKRLTRQFPDEILADILHALAPSHASSLADIVDHFRRMLRRNNFTSGSERELVCFVWEVLINELLKTGGTSFDTTNLVSRIVKKISLHWGWNYQWMLTILASETVNHGTRKGPGAELVDTLQTLTRREEGKPKEEASSDVELLRGRLADAMVRGDITWIRDRWRDISRNRPELLKSVIIHYGKQVTIRKKMALGFPDPILRDVVHLLEPAESGFINEIVSSPEVFQQARGEPSEGAGGTKRRLWEFTLSYLLVERGSRFNKKTYLGSMIRQMAAHDNIRSSDLLASLTGVLERVGAPGGLKGEMLELLRGLAEEAGDRQHTDRDGHTQNNESIRADVIYEKISQHLLHADKTGENAEQGLAQVFHELGRENPGMLLRLYQRLSVEELHRLIRTFLTITQQAEKEVISDFMGALESYGDRAGNRKSYYWQVFECLLRNEVIDFELIAGGNIPPDVEGVSDKKLQHIENQEVDPEAQGVRTAEQSLLKPGDQSDEKSLPESEVLELELPHIAKGLEEDEDAFTEEIYIANAGLVLAAPYLPRLFAMLELTEGLAFKDRKAAERAVHLLQFMVNESTASPEYQLVLNKILCGVRTGIPITREINITDSEKETIEGLIQGMIQNWKTIGKTSVQGLRESFLQREGRLGLKDDTWHLLVEQRAFDMLLDRLPWSFSIIKHPWMERVVHVEWR